MPYEQRDNSGSLFKNDRREKESHPTHTGTIMVNGREYWLSAWTKEANGKRFFSLSVKPKEQRQTQDNRQQQRDFANRAQSQQPAPEFDSEVPF